MGRVIVGSIVGCLFGTLVASIVVLALLNFAPSLGAAGVLLAAIWFGGQWAVVGGLVGATSAIIDALRQRSQPAAEAPGLLPARSASKGRPC